MLSSFRLVFTVSILVEALPAFGQQADATADIVAKAAKSVVVINCAGDAGMFEGSGFIISSDGRIATNLHVIRDMKSCGVKLATGEIFDDLVVMWPVDKRRDLAIVKIPGFDLPAVELGNSDNVRPGEPVVAIGSPRGLQGTVTAGVVSAIRDDPESGGYKVIQTDTAINPGNSGGPLLDQHGQVIGVVTKIRVGSEGLSFALPINYVRGLIASPETPMKLSDLQGALSESRTDLFNASASFPSVWKSLQTGNSYIIREEKDFIYVERSFSIEEKQRGNFGSLDLRKTPAGYSGQFHLILLVPYRGGFLGRQTNYSRCTFDFPVEIASISASRIEGRIKEPPLNSILVYSSCTYDAAPDWQNFVWIPQ
jgi:hypothetical protein